MSSKPFAAASGVEPFVRQYWGKARDKVGGRWHPLAYHMADVAACAVAIAEVRPWFLEWVADCLGRRHGWDAEGVRRMVGLFGYAHDLGKHATGFQAQVGYAYRACTGVPPAPSAVAAKGISRHDALGMVAWHRKGSNLPWAILGDGLDAADRAAWKPLASAAFGHHGHPIDPSEDGRLIAFREVMRKEDLMPRRRPARDSGRS